MREPLALLSALAFAAAAGGLAVLAPNALGFTAAFVSGALAFWLALSRDESFEREIDELLHEHAEGERWIAQDAGSSAARNAGDASGGASRNIGGAL